MDIEDEAERQQATGNEGSNTDHQAALAAESTVDHDTVCSNGGTTTPHGIPQEFLIDDDA